MGSTIPFPQLVSRISSINLAIPIPSMYGIFTYIYHNNQPNAGEYTIHGCFVQQPAAPGLVPYAAPSTFMGGDRWGALKDHPVYYVVNNHG